MKGGSKKKNIAASRVGGRKVPVIGAVKAFYQSFSHHFNLNSIIGLELPR